MQIALAPVPSRREARREMRRDAILDVAKSSFLEHGYAGTTMSGIAATLGGSKATLWSYFASKDLLFAAVLDRAIRQFHNELVLLLTPNKPIAEALHQFCRQFIAILTLPDAISLHRLVAAEARRFPEVGEIFYSLAPGETRKQLGSFMAEAMNRGELRRADAMIAAQHLTGLCMSGSHMLLLVGALDVATPQMIEHDAELAVEAFLGGYSA